MPLPRVDLLHVFIVSTSPYERYVDPIPIIFEVHLQAKKPSILVHCKYYCSFLTAKSKLGNYNTIPIPKYDGNGTPKAQATQR